MSPYIEVGWVWMHIINLDSAKSPCFFPSFIMFLQHSAVTDVICKTSVCKQKPEAAQGHGGLSMIFKKKLTLQKVWEESVDTSRTNSSLSTAISNPVKCTLCSPECSPYFSLAHLCTWTSMITLITALEQEGILRFTRFACCAVASLLFSSWVQHVKTLRDTRNRFHSWNLHAKTWLLI